MDAWTIGLLVAGLAFLVAGAESLVRGASRLAASVGISPLVIGLTVVAYGTGAPELTVSVTAGIAGRADIAIANVIGSNILNVLLILGVTTLVSPVVVAQRFVRREVPIMIGVSLLLYVLAYDGRIGVADGCMFLVGIFAYTAAAVLIGNRESPSVEAEYAGEFGRERLGSPKKGVEFVKQLAIVGVGISLLVLGSRWLVAAATTIATALGVSDVVIGLTVVAFGTSLPEIATSVIAAFRGERDIAVGNVVGSNIFNVLGILGVSALVTDGGLSVAPSMIAFDIPVMIAVAVACLPIFFTGFAIDRWEGLVLVAYYVAYTSYLVMDATGHDALPFFSATMAGFVMPLTGVTLAVLVWNASRPQRGRTH